jgi:hypothetical protein
VKVLFIDRYVHVHVCYVVTFVTFVAFVTFIRSQCFPPPTLLVSGRLNQYVYFDIHLISEMRHACLLWVGIWVESNCCHDHGCFPTNHPSTCAFQIKIDRTVAKTTAMLQIP